MAKTQYHHLLQELESIPSEGRNPNTMDIDLLSSRDILKKINAEDQRVADAVAAAIDDIAAAVDLIVAAFAKGGRLIYMGAGTSGRLGILDAVECLPTFSVPENMVVGIIAGGDRAICRAVEGAEDNRALAIQDLANAELTSDDVVVGIAASGRTPYVISALEYASNVGASTVAVACNPQAPIFVPAQVKICAEVGAEALTGSTRMKSGTAQKMILNMLSTAAMIRSGKTYQNLMVDVNASNEKLRARAIRIVMQATDCQKELAESILKQANDSAKLAILMILTGMSAEQGAEQLSIHKGFLRASVEKAVE